MCHAAEEGVGAGPRPTTGERVEVRVGEVNSPTPFQSEPYHEDAERYKVRPKVYNVVIPPKHALKGVREGCVRLTISFDDVRLSVHRRHLVSM